MVNISCLFKNKKTAMLDIIKNITFFFKVIFLTNKADLQFLLSCIEYTIQFQIINTKSISTNDFSPKSALFSFYFFKIKWVTTKEKRKNTPKKLYLMNFGFDCLTFSLDYKQTNKQTKLQQQC